MSQLSQWGKKQRIRQGKPIEMLNLTFYPIKMSFYEQFLTCKDALIIRLGTLPVKYQMKDYLNAIFSLEIDETIKNGAGSGLFSRLLLLMSLSLRIDDFDLKEYMKGENIVIKQVGKDLEIVRFKMTQGDNVAEITPQDFSALIRPLIADQNGLELPDDSENEELVLAQKQLQEMQSGNQVKLKTDLGSLVSSVAYFSKVSEREIDDWTIREFENRYKAIDRDKKYTLYGQAELSGMVTFKKGNPFPSWAYDSIDESMGTMSASDLGKQFGGAKQK